MKLLLGIPLLLLASCASPPKPPILAEATPATRPAVDDWWWWQGPPNYQYLSGPSASDALDMARQDQQRLWDSDWQWWFNYYRDCGYDDGLAATAAYNIMGHRPMDRPRY